MVSVKMVYAAANADAEFAGRTFEALSSSERLRYLERAKLMIDAAFEASLTKRWMWEEKRYTDSDVWDDMYDNEKPPEHKDIRNVRELYSKDAE